jgi:TRAP-type C4-dicarboxylate transport system permease small subunit
MTRLTGGVETLCKALHWVAGAALLMIMLVTILDVVLRYHGRPIPGTYELVGFAGGIAIGLAMPLTSWRRGHIYVDTFLTLLPARVRALFNLVTRLAGFALFLLLGWNLCRMAFELRASGEVSPTLELPFYPVVLGVAAAALLLSVVLLCHIVLILRGEYD